KAFWMDDSRKTYVLIVMISASWAQQSTSVSQWETTYTNTSEATSVTIPPVPKTSGEMGYILVDIRAVIGVVVAEVVLLIVIVSTCWVLRGRQNVTQPLPVEELAMRERESAVPEEPGSYQSVHYYMEVPDSPLPSDEEDVAAEPPPRPCHGPGNLPDDYLNPGPSHEETEEEGTEWKTIPFYENTQIRNMETTGGASSILGSESSAENTSIIIETGPPNTVNSSDGSEETDYVRHSPSLYENTSP
ncbi:hypothetical protein BaRGS_00033030, partial [Batillaria attramentaria]